MKIAPVDFTDDRLLEEGAIYASIPRSGLIYFIKSDAQSPGLDFALMKSVCTRARSSMVNRNIKTIFYLHSENITYFAIISLPTDTTISFTGETFTCTVTVVIWVENI